MKINVKETKVICSNPNSMHNYFGWPSVARLQDSSLMAVASGFRVAHICPFGKVVAVRSTDEGKTWTKPEVVLDTPLDDRDGGITPFGEKGVIIATFNNTPTFQRKNCQAKLTYANAYLDEVEKKGGWEKYNGSLLTFSYDGGKTFGEPVKVPISSPHGPCELSDGRILYVGRLFNDENSIAHLECHIIDERGNATFLSRIDNINDAILSCEPHAIQLKSGRIVCHIRGQYKDQMFTIYQSVSDDNGLTWTKPVQLLADKGGSPAHLIEMSNGALVSVYGYREAPYGIRAMVSYDGGETWDVDNVVLDDQPAPDLGYPASVELENGDLLTVFYSREFKGGASVLKQTVWNFEK